MEALILAAGRGERLGELTKKTPKPLIPLGGVPILCRVLDNLEKAGVTGVLIVTGYKGDQISKQIGEYWKSLKIRYLKNQEWRRGNLYSLLAANGRFSENFLLSMGDHLFDPRIVKALAQHKLNSSVALAVNDRFALQEDTKVLVEGNKIIDIGKDIKESNRVDTGLYLCSPKIFEYAVKVSASGKDELANCIKYAASAGDTECFEISQLHQYLPELRRDVKPFWIDIDTKEDIVKAKKLLIETSTKGASDFLAYYVHKPIENKLVYYLADFKITPNQLTILINVLAYFVAYLFYSGWLLLASGLTFLVGVMDGLDGKLARVKGTSSKLGTMEHPFDLLYEFAWFIALSLFLFNSTKSSTPLVLCLFIILFIAFYRHCYDRFRSTMDRSLDDYGRFAKLFRRVAGRRNLFNIHILLFVILGMPIYCLITILAHSVITAAVYATSACKHMYQADKRKTQIS